MPNKTRHSETSSIMRPDTSETMELNRRAVEFISVRNFEQGIHLLNMALSRNPFSETTLHNLGATYTMQGNSQSAITCYVQVISINPRAAKAHFNLANIYRSKGETERAIYHLEETLKIDPKHHSAAHILATCTGKTPGRAPLEYVRQLFDQFSANFEECLVKELHYKTPSALLSLFNKNVREPHEFDSLLDLGCGTGLAGIEFKVLCKNMTGVDISANMLKQCREKGLYKDLAQEDIQTYLQNTPSRFDLFVSADVLIYFGNLAPIFEGVRRCSKTKSYFIFSTEHFEGSAFQLRETGRFAHSTNYVLDSAKEFGFKLVSQEKQNIRRDAGSDINGELFVFQADH